MKSPGEHREQKLTFPGKESIALRLLREKKENLPKFPDLYTTYKFHTSDCNIQLNPNFQPTRLPYDLPLPLSVSPPVSIPQAHHPTLPASSDAREF